MKLWLLLQKVELEICVKRCQFYGNIGFLVINKQVINFEFVFWYLQGLEDDLSKSLFSILQK